MDPGVGVAPTSGLGTRGVAPATLVYEYMVSPPCL